MKSTKVVIAMLALSIGFMASSALASFSESLAKDIVRARVTTGGTPIVEISVEIRDAIEPEAPSVASLIGWTVDIPGTGWKVSDQVLRIDAQITDFNGAVQIYTDNTNDGAVPQFVDLTPGSAENPAGFNNPDSNPAGLVHSQNPGRTLPMAWAVKTSTRVVGNTSQTRGIVAVNPNHVGPDVRCPTDPLDPNNPFQWFFVLDAKTPAIDSNGDGDVDDLLTADDRSACPSPDLEPFTPGDTFVTMMNSDGIHHSQGPNGFRDEQGNSGVRYVYFEADFSTALAQQIYATGMLVVETYLQ